MLKGMVYSLMPTYFYQNTHAADYRAAVLWLFHHLIAQGWDKDELKKSILAADAKLQIRNQAGDPVPAAKLHTCDNIFFHLSNHPFGIPKRCIHQLYDLHCQEAFSTHLGINNLTIAYSQHQCLKEHLTRASLHQALGKEASTYYATHRISHMETNHMSHGNPHNSIWFSKKILSFLLSLFETTRNYYTEKPISSFLLICILRSVQDQYRPSWKSPLAQFFDPKNCQFLNFLVISSKKLPFACNFETAAFLKIANFAKKLQKTQAFRWKFS
jgi:hypothetical protein